MDRMDLYANRGKVLVKGENYEEEDISRKDKREKRKK